MSDEITVTLTSMATQATDSISISSSMTVTELRDFAVAILNLPSSEGVVLSKDGKRLPLENSTRATLSAAGIKNGDLILVLQAPARGGGSNNRSAVSTNAATRGPSASSGGGGGGGIGGLDFSSLISTTAAAAPASSSARASGGNAGAGGGGLTFNLPSLAAASAMTSNTTNNNSASQQSKQGPIQWQGMNLDQAISNNPNPEHFVKILLDEQNHPNLLKELNYHNAPLAKKLKEAGLQNNAHNVWRLEQQKNTMNSTLSKTMEAQEEASMHRRLQLNPMDAEANAYFGEQIRKKNVMDQYHQMMDEFPESMGRVLMLYIDVEVNGRAIQAFVDSGAQSTIMSSKCAEECGLLHLLDTRFEGTAVGVGTGKILGRIHIAPMKVKGHFFPCTITVMDSEKGLGDKNMDFLFGLDMLKRHRCNIDLARNLLVFSGSTGNSSMLETPFLHEKDLSTNKGGTKDFNAEQSNMEIEEMMKKDGEDKK